MTKEVFAVIVSVLGIVFSVFSLGIAFLTYWHNQKDKKLLRAPLIVIRDEFINISESIRYDFPDDLPYNPSPRKFSLDRRCFKKFEIANGQPVKETEEIVGAYISLIMDTTPENTYQSKKIEKIVNYGRFNMLNMGYDCLSMQIKSIDVSLKNRNSMPLAPTEHNSLDICKTKGEDFNMGFTVIYAGDEYAPFVLGIEDNFELIRQKAANTKNGVMNTYMPVAPDLWEKITLTVFTKNIHDEEYKQEINLYFRDNTYYTDSKLLGKIK